MQIYILSSDATGSIRTPILQFTVRSNFAMTSETSTSLALSPEQQCSYFKLQTDAVQAASYLAEALGLPEYKHDARSAIILDLVSHVVTTCQKLQLGPHQTSAVLSIAQQLLDSCASGASREQAQQQLRSSLLQLCSASPSPPDTVAAASGACAVGLSPDAIAGLAACLTRDLLQHYSLYLLVFTQEQQHVQHQHHLMVESAVPPPPLELSLSEPNWQAHLAAEQAQREADQAAAEAAEQARKESEEAARIVQQQAEEAAARQEQLQRKPKTLEEAVDKLVALRLEDVRHGLAADYAGRAAALAARVGQLEQQQQAALGVPATAKSSRAGSAASKA